MPDDEVVTTGTALPPGGVVPRDGALTNALHRVYGALVPMEGDRGMHYYGLVIGPDVDEQMAPYSEDVEVEPTTLVLGDPADPAGLELEAYRRACLALADKRTRTGDLTDAYRWIDKAWLCLIVPPVCRWMAAQ